MNRKYNLKLDLQFRCNNSTMKFNQFDNNTSDFFMRITNGGNLVDIEKAIVVLAIIKPSGKVASQFVEIENGLVYADLKPNMRDEIGTYTAQAMLILEDERVVTDVIGYEVEEDKIFSLLNDSVGTSEEFTLLTDMLNRLSTIETSEEQRVINEAERILSEENRKIEEAKRVEAELIRQHEEADRAKYDATRESNENIRKQNESIRLANETNRIDEETKRVEEETKRVEAEQLRKDNYNFMTEDEERRRSEANAHKEAEALRVQAETNRVNEEAKRRTTEQARILAENTRVSNENTRKANETARQTNETKRVEAETQRQNRYNSFIADAEANASNFENYTNTAKAKEEERKSNELDRKSQEVRRISNEVERISNENTRKANENAREKNETSRQYVFENKVNEVDKKIIEINATKDNFVSNINTKVDTKISEIEVAKSDMTNTVSNKINEVENRFNALTSKQQQDAEVVDARDGETSLKARLDRDIEKAKQVYVNVEGSHISTDSSSGYAKDVEILGNTIQNASNLADIRSVGDKVEGQELYEIPVLIRGKNLFNGKWERGYVLNLVPSSPLYGKLQVGENYSTTQDFIKVSPNEIYYFTNTSAQRWVIFYDKDKNPISHQETWGSCTTPNNTAYIRFYDHNTRVDAFPNYSMSIIDNVYEPYIEDKLTILSPVQLEKVGDVADRIVCKDGIWGVEKNIVTKVLNGNEGTWHITNNGEYLKFGNYGVCTDAYFTLHSGKPVISDKFVTGVYTSGEATQEQVMYHCHGDLRAELRISILASKVGSTGFEGWLKDNNVTIKYRLAQPQFIPLPHSQQVKLRTFANKTNISFRCEIEGTIKAQVPKSIGATVNTHTEQINNLNKELDRVKKLEESTVSTVTTESDFTTVEATSNGYFEDVKLEGKTLVNLTKNTSYSVELSGLTSEDYTITKSDRYIKFTKTNTGKNPSYIYVSGGFVPFDLIKPNTQYTIKLEKCLGVKEVTFKSGNGINAISSRGVFDANGCALITTNDNIDKVPNNIQLIYLYAHNSVTDIEVSNIVILEGDHTQNPPSYFEGLMSVGEDVDEIVVSSNNNQPKQIETTDDNSITTTIDNPNYQSDKKRLLYYNEETQTWEKPILREWDSIEKHANGKYYYHQRSGEVVFDGSENWNNDKNSSTMSPETYRQSIQFNAIDIPSASFDTKTSPNIISDLLPTVVFGDVYSYNRIGISISGTDSIATHIIINNNFTDVTELKQWLQTNNLTVVYQLAEEKVYECTNIDLITYNGETNFIVESGVLSPRTTLKVHNNISNVVSLLQKKVSLLESNVKASQEVQDMMILETDMRMLDIELALMEFIPINLNLGGSDMLRSATYFNFLKNHIINETYEKEYLENVMNKYLATGRINQDEYNELYKMLYPPVYDIELPIEY